MFHVEHVQLARAEDLFGVPRGTHRLSLRVPHPSGTICFIVL